jgi:hypothetical protein
MPAPPARNEISAPYPVPSAGAARVGFGKWYDYVFGLLGPTGNPAEARDALRIGPVISNRNRVDNSIFAVNRRGLSGTVVLPAGQTGFDRWKAGAGGCTFTFTASGNGNLLTISAGSLVHVIEGRDVEGGDYVMSWAGNAQGKIAGGAAAASGVTASGITANANLSIEFGTGTLGKVQLEPGTLQTPYEAREYDQELLRCERFLPAFVAPVVGHPIAQGQCTSGTSALVFFKFRVEPRVVPSGVISVGTAYLLTAAGSATGNLGSFAYTVASLQGAICTATVASGLVAGDSTVLNANSTNSAFLFTGAEL